MTEPLSRSVVDAFYQAYATRDAGKIAPFIHDEVEWTISGPVDFLPFCGTHRGKAAVLDLIERKVKAVMRTVRFLPESIVVDGEPGAMLRRQAAARPSDGRIISYRVANIMRFRDGQVIENFSLIDTFDAVEQVLGQPLVSAERRAGVSEPAPG